MEHRRHRGRGRRDGDREVGIDFSPPNSACVDAHTYAGISFKIGGMISGCTLDYVLAVSEETSQATT